MKRICVFCGSHTGVRPAYKLAAEAVGKLMASRGIELVYGAGKIGLMGIVADAILAAGGQAIGVIPEGLLAREVAYPGLTKLHIVKSMHERKALMAELSDAFVALPGGFGTFEEFCEVLTWAQLGIHQKPCGLLNVDGYYDSLMALFNHALQEEFITPQTRSLVLEAKEPEELLELLNDYRPVTVPRWIGLDRI